MKGIITNTMSVVVMATALIFINMYALQHTRSREALEVFQNEQQVSYNEANIAHVQKELLRRNAGDCLIEKTAYGYKCTEFQTRKVYKVVLE